MVNYNRERFKGYILYGIREEVTSKTNDFRNSKVFIGPVAVFDKERDAKDYVESVKLVSSQGGGDAPRISFKKNSLLSGCFTYDIGPKPHLDNVEVNPEPFVKKEDKEEKPKKKRKRRTKAEIEAARAAGEESPKKKKSA